MNSGWYGCFSVGCCNIFVYGSSICLYRSEIFFIINSAAHVPAFAYIEYICNAAGGCAALCAGCTAVSVCVMRFLVYNRLMYSKGF